MKVTCESTGQGGGVHMCGLHSPAMLLAVPALPRGPSPRLYALSHVPFYSPPEFHIYCHPQYTSSAIWLASEREYKGSDL